MTEPIAVLVLVLTAGVFAFLIPFASHRTHLLLLSRRAREEIRDPWPEDDLPVVTVQLPMYNERAVAERAIDAACALDYPPDRLEVQVLDDSDDRMQKKIRNAQLLKVPFMVIAGQDDLEAGAVSFRYRDGRQDNGIPIDDAIQRVVDSVSTKEQV